MADQPIAQPHPQALLDGPQIGRLPHKGRAMDCQECREKVAVMTAKVLKQLLILAQSQITANEFDGNHLAIAESRWPAVTVGKASSIQPATGENEIVQAHGFSPYRFTCHTEESKSLEPFLCTFFYTSAAGHRVAGSSKMVSPLVRAWRFLSVSA